MITITQYNEILPEDEKFVRTYIAFEGGIRLVSKDSKGNEHRYNVVETSNGAVLQKND